MNLAATLAAVAACPPGPGMDLASADLAAIRSVLASGAVSAEALVAEYRDRRVALRGLGAVIRENPSGSAVARRVDVRREAGATARALEGVPIIVKDNLDVRGLPTTGGSIALRADRARSNALVVSRLERAGAIVVAKANMGELADAAIGVGGGGSTLGGPVRNPFGGSPGSSSSGSAVAVAVGLSPVALGTDTAGSILGPAQALGVVGFRPSFGRIPTSGMMPYLPSSDTVGPLAMNVRDARVVAGVLAGQPLRFSFPRSFRVASATPLPKGLGTAVAAAGGTVVRASLPSLVRSRRGEEFAGAMGDWLRGRTVGISSVAALADRLRKLGAPDPGIALLGRTSLRRAAAAAALNRRAVARNRRAFRMFMARHELDAVVTSAPSLAASVGAPAIALPRGSAKRGAPTSVMLVGRPQGDARLLAVAERLEGALPPRPLPPACAQ